MLKLTIANLGAHKRRLAASICAVAIGVAFLSGVLIQTTTLQSGFDDLFDTASASVDAVVRGDTTITDATDETIRSRFDGAAVEQIRDLPQVRAAATEVVATAVVIGASGEEVGAFGPPRLGRTWIGDRALSPFELSAGRAPVAPEEVVLEVATAEAAELAVGDETTVLAPEPVRVHVVGLATFGGRDSAGGATTVLFSPAGADTHLVDRPGSVDTVLVDAADGVTQAALTKAIEPLAPLRTEVIDGETYRQENRDAADDVMGFLRPALLAFAAIALVVAAFSVTNTFAIVVAQRTREAAMLRAIGATRAQTLGAVLIEAALVGVAGSLIGLAAGIGVAAVLGLVLAGASLDLGNALVVEAGTLVACAVAGTAMAVACAFAPAVRACRVAPVAALVDSALDSTATSRARLVAGVVALVAGVGTILWAVVTDAGMAAASIGLAALLVATSVGGPVAARPIAALLGAPLRLRGITGDLARQNGIRNPRRTSSAATALVIGVAVVTLFTVLAASIKVGVDRQVRDGFAGDLIATTSLGGSGFSPEVARRIEGLPEVANAAGLGNAPMRVAGTERIVGVSDPSSIAEVIDLEVLEGSFEAVQGPAFAVASSVASEHGWSVGTEVPYEFLDGSAGNARIAMVFRDSDLVGEFLSSTEFTSDRGAPVTDDAVVVQLAPGVSIAQGRAAVEAAVADVPSISVKDKDQFSAMISAEIDTVLYLVYGMLGLSILIALLGIANTLSLATLERTRELGLLRALGQLRGQTRAMVRWESVVVAVYGTAVGLVVGVTGAWALLSSDSAWAATPFAVPAAQIAVVLVLGALAGVAAGIRPAARAARLDPLTAISTV